MKALNGELKEIARFCRSNYNEIIVISLATLFLMLNYYNTIGERWLSSLVYYFILPFISIVAVLRKNPLDFGLRPGNIRVWGLYVLILAGVLTVLVLGVLVFASMKGYYKEHNFNVSGYVFEIVIVLFSWEFLFRGFLLFGLKEKFGEAAIIIQMIPFALRHIGKPELEAVSCIFAGLLFGFVAYRAGSFWPAYIIHLYVNLLNKFINNGI
ncbi:MAG: CPBP family intramembrane metalloprotease [Spirochaetes bacterium]|nr:CPBP family intramembrane metalloprotease [Spirochaetota bacterium]